MPTFFYHFDGKIHGPFSEQDVQGWYISGYFSSEIKFQISTSDRYDPNAEMLTLGELIKRHGRTLPFSSELLEDTDRRSLEGKLETMGKELELLQRSLENNQKETQSDKALIQALQSQVASLVESQSDLLRRMDEMSNRREDSTVPPQLEKKVKELTKKVDEQEKNVSSMKKELSAMNSICDSNDSKLKKLLEKQKGTENLTSGFDKRISDLKASEKSVRDNITSCQQKVSSSSTELSSIRSELSELNNAMKKSDANISTTSSELSSIRGELIEIKSAMKQGTEKSAELATAMEKLKERIKRVSFRIDNQGELLTELDADMHKREMSTDMEELRAELEDLREEVEELKEAREELEEASEGSTEEKSGNDAQEQLQSAFVPAESDTERPPWEITTEANTETEVSESKEVIEVKEDEDEKEEEEEDDPPWNDKHSRSLRPRKRCFEDMMDEEKENDSPWGNMAKSDSDVGKSKEMIEENEDKPPWDDDKAAGDCVVKRSEKMIGKKKKERAPWDDMEDNSDAGVEKERSPWECDQSQPSLEETNDEPEPWNQMNGRSKKDAMEAQKTGNGLSIEKNGGKTEVAPAKTVKVAAAVKPAKDWNAICAELSDDEEPDGTGSTAADREQRARGAERFVSDFVALLRVYCTAIDTPDFESLTRNNFNIRVMLTYTDTFDQTTLPYGQICVALKEEIRRLASHIHCHVCTYNITTPRHLLYHFSDSLHVQRARLIPEQCRAAYADMTNLVISVFYRFIMPRTTINELTSVEYAHLEKGRERARSGQYPVLKLRPTAQFMNVYTGKNMMEIGNHLSKQFPAGPYSMSNKEMSSDVRGWVEANKPRLETELRAHLKEGIPFCSPCAAIFESVDEYYQHMTSYNHLAIDKSLFARDVVFCMGRDYWDAML